MDIIAIIDMIVIMDIIDIIAIMNIIALIAIMDSRPTAIIAQIDIIGIMSISQCG
jgi:hypothetical protein